MFRVQSSTQTKSTSLLLENSSTSFGNWTCAHHCICCLHGYSMLQTLHRSESFQKVFKKLWWVQWDQFHQPLWWPGQDGSETPNSLPWPRARTFGDGKSRGAEGGGAGKDRHWGHSQWQTATRLHQGREPSKSKIKSRVWISDCAEKAPAQGGRVAVMHWKCEQCHTQYSNNYCNLLTGILHKYTFPPLGQRFVLLYTCYSCFNPLHVGVTKAVVKFIKCSWTFVKTLPSCRNPRVTTVAN